MGVDEDECESLRAIYADDGLTIEPQEISLRVLARPMVKLRILVPDNYPDHVPVFFLESDSELVTDEMRESINAALEEVSSHLNPRCHRPLCGSGIGRERWRTVLHCMHRDGAR